MFILNLNIQKLIFCSCLVDSTDEVINELWTFINVRREEFQKSCSVCCPCPLVHSQKNQTIYYPAQQRIIYTFFSKGKEAEKNSFVHYNVSKFLLPQSFIQHFLILYFIQAFIRCMKNINSNLLFYSIYLWNMLMFLRITQQM